MQDNISLSLSLSLCVCLSVSMLVCMSNNWWKIRIVSFYTYKCHLFVPGKGCSFNFHHPIHNPVTAIVQRGQNWKYPQQLEKKMENSWWEKQNLWGQSPSFMNEVTPASEWILQVIMLTPEIWAVFSHRDVDCCTSLNGDREVEGGGEKRERLKGEEGVETG